MSLVFENMTAHEALRFDQIDPHGEPYHVFVVRIGYMLAPASAGHAGLQEDDEVALLVEEDHYFGAMNQSSVRCESDLAPYKPRCDVIVNATAHAPKGKAARRFAVRLTVRRPDTPAPLPDAPQPLNPYIPLSLKEQQAWQAALERARHTSAPGEVLIDKTLTVTGPRQFRKKWLFTRLVQWLIKWSTLALIRPNPWKLTWPQKIVALPLRYEAAYGGQCRINEKDNAHLAAGTRQQEARLKNSKRLAERVAKKFRLTPEQLAGHPDLDVPLALLPVAHSVCESNPIGIGFAETWFLKATGCKVLPAPQIEHPKRPITASLFWKAARGKLKGKAATRLEPAGLGAIGRAWLPRRRLIGTIDEKTDWAEDEYPQLPPDFDHGYWNCAPADQQCPLLAGDELIELTNLCPASTPGSEMDRSGQVHLRFQLPGTRPYLILADGDGIPGAKLLDLDTLIIEAESGRVDLVWRTVITARAELAVAQLHHAGQSTELKALKPQLPPTQRAAIPEHTEVTHGA